ncbi:hypothetical protein PAMP_007288 [Pampus punctatissimus]
MCIEEDKSTNMPVSRMRMRPWLEKMIDSKTISGLSWVDKDNMTFSIPWKHAARHGWEMDKDACLFKQWAIHTGKFTEGQTCDPKTWKANFRCAMNSLSDIKEMKDKSVNKGHQAVRVFKMLPASPKSRDKRNKAKETRSKKKVKKEEDIDYTDTQSPMVQSQLCDDSSSTQEDTVDSTVDTMQNDLITEVPDWCFSFETGPSSSNNFSHRFEVSPDQSPNYDTADEIIEICKKLEKDSKCYQSSLDSFTFLNHEVHSPSSQWSDSSSGEEFDKTPEYITLGSNFTVSDDLWRHMSF